MVKVMYYTNYFFICSILGFLLETCFYTLFKWDGGSGILYGPWTPVYGIGAIIIIIFFDFIFKKINTNKFSKFIIFFVSICIFLSIIELIGGILIEQIFNITFWDYSNHKYHIGKYISLEMALVWGLASTLFIFLLRPLIDKFIYKIPKIITYILIILIVIDTFFTIFNKVK